jgi:hypothetical protein
MNGVPLAGRTDAGWRVAIDGKLLALVPGVD